MSGIHAFEEESPPDLSAEVATILMAPAELTEDQALALYAVLAPRFTDGDFEYGADFDLAGEVGAQIRAVRAMRRLVMTDDGVVVPGTPAREVKETVTASNTLLNTLLKTHEKVLNFNRLRAIETATSAALEDLDESAKTVFFQRLEKELEGIK